MAKIYGLFGSMTGKLADTVMSVRNGEQIARKYQPVVLNPSTPAQVAQRAKLKLLSQLSAVMAPAIGFRKNGSVSARNMFTKANIGKTTFADDTAEIPYTGVDLTGGILALPNLTVTAGTSSVSCELGATAIDLDNVMYFVFRVDGTELRYAGSATATAGENKLFPATVPVSGAAGDTYAILGYGVRINEESAKAKYGSLIIDVPGTAATLAALRSLNSSDYSLTETRGTQVLVVE